MLATPRLIYAMAEHDQLPRALSRVHERFRTPHVAIAVQGLLAFALAVPGSFEELAKLSAIARIVSYASTCAALPVFRRTRPVAHSFRVPGGLLVPAAAVLLCVVLVASSSAMHLALGAVAVGVGCGLYWLGARERSPQRP